LIDTEFCYTAPAASSSLLTLQYIRYAQMKSHLITSVVVRSRMVLKMQIMRNWMAGAAG